MVLENINASKRFRDPIYGFIYLTENEVKIVDTPLFQRLRRVHQLALTKYVYPAAEHSRFVHSLGVLHTASRLFQGILRNSKKTENIISNEEDELLAQYKILRYAALLHDIGHVPFSHACETAFLGNGCKHEDISRYIIENYEPISKIIESDEISPKVVSSLLTDIPTRQYSIIQKIVSGQLDADRADYLLRDSHACGVKYGEYDYERFINSLYLTSENGLLLNINERDIYILESFLLARYHYTIQVPFHRTRVGYNIALEQFIANLPKEHDIFQAVEHNNGQLKIDFDLFEFLDDYLIFELIKKNSREGDAWAKMLLRQAHLAPVFDRTQTHEDDDFKFRLRTQFLSDSGLVENQDFFIYSKSLGVSKLINRESDTKDKPSETIYVRSPKEPGYCEDILEHSEIIRRLARPHRLLRIYATPESKQKVESALAQKQGEFDRARRK